MTEPKSIYLIERMELNPREDHPMEALRYLCVGFVHDEERAKELCSKARTFMPWHCTGIKGPLREFRYRALDEVVTERDLRFRRGLDFSYYSQLD